MTWLAERGVQCVSSTMMAQGGKYDNYHLHDHQFNRKLVYRFLREAITLHLKYVEVMSKRGDLRHYVESFIKNEQDRVAAVHLFQRWSNSDWLCLELRKSCKPSHRHRRRRLLPRSSMKLMKKFSCGCMQESLRRTMKPPEGRPKPTDFTDEEMSSIVPVDPTIEDADAEEQRARLHLQEDLNQAVADGFSVATVMSPLILNLRWPATLTTISSRSFLKPTTGTW